MKRELDGNIVFNNSLLDPERDMVQKMFHEANGRRTWYFDDIELRAITDTTHKKLTFYESD